jgi:hypothetical protein
VNDYIDGEIKFKRVSTLSIVAKRTHNDVGVDLNQMIIPKILDQSMPYKPISLIDKHPMLVLLP